MRVFEWSSGSWSQLGSDIDGEAANDQSGYLSAELGRDDPCQSSYNDGTGSNAGRARVYQFERSWTQLGSDIDGEAADDNSGWSVS